MPFNRINSSQMIIFLEQLQYVVWRYYKAITYLFKNAVNAVFYRLKLKSYIL